MLYFVNTLIMIFLIVSIERKKKIVLKSKNVMYFRDSLNYNFDFVKILCVSVSFVSLVMLIIVKMEQGGFISFQIQDFKLSFLPYILYSIMIVPLFEEYFYRFLPLSFSRYSNILVSVIVIFFSSLFFAYFHSLDSFTSVFVFVMAVIFSVMFLKTKNVCYPIMSHSLYNLISNLRIFVKFDSFNFYLIIFIISIVILVFYNKRNGKVKDI